MSFISTDSISHISLRNLGDNLSNCVNSLNRLSTKSRINRGADDPAGVISAENLRAALAMLESENRAHQRTVQVANTADGALGEISSLLTNAKTLAVTNTNTSGLSEEERAANQLELDSIIDSVDRIASNTSFNGISLLDGSLTLSDGADSLDIDSTGSTAIGEIDVSGVIYHLSDVITGGELDTAGENYEYAVDAINQAISDIATQRAMIGGVTNRITGRINANSIAYENTAASLSTIVDADYAAETTSLTRNQLLSQASIYSLLLLNQSNTKVLDLLNI